MGEYAAYGGEVGIYADPVTSYLYYALQEKNQKLEIKHTYFDILHMKSRSLREVLQNDENQRA
jgi:hypothetical protein